MVVLGNKLTALRSLLSIDQIELARGLGVTKATVSNWENDKTFPAWNILNVLVNAGVSGDFFFREGSQVLRPGFSAQQVREAVLRGRQ